MSEREDGYRHGLADAEKACRMIADMVLKDNLDKSGDQQRVAQITANTLNLAAKAISELEYGFISPLPGVSS